MNWLRHLKLYWLALVFWPALAFAAEPSSVQVQWVIYSGRPDPTFAISEVAAVRQLVAIFEALPPHPTLTDPNSVSPSQSGYRGFHVTPTGWAGVSGIDVYGSAVAVASGGSNGVPLSWSFRFDKNAALEQLLFQAGRAQGTITDGAPELVIGAGAAVIERSVTISLGAAIVSAVAMPIQPPVTVRAGTRVKLIAAQADEKTIDVVWVKDSRALPATGRTLEIADASPAASGRYWAVVGLGNGRSTTSAQTELLVTTRDGQRLLNLSVLGRISAEQRVLTSGFTIEAGAGNLRTLVLIRAIGTGLAPFAVGDPLRAPCLRVMDTNGADVAPANMPFALPSVAVASERVGAFAVPPNSADLAQLYYLPAGGFTAHVSSADAGTGAVLIEIFEVPLN